jgi:hypothetical protein
MKRHKPTPDQVKAWLQEYDKAHEALKPITAFLIAWRSANGWPVRVQSLQLDEVLRDCLSGVTIVTNAISHAHQRAQGIDR